MENHVKVLIVLIAFSAGTATVALQARCWEYTWVGPVDESINATRCSTLQGKDKDRPCFEPLVWTNQSHNQPNLEQLEEYCKTANTVTGTNCDPFCTKNDDVCIKMTYFTRDGSGTATYTSSFCGKGIETTADGRALKDTCHYQENVDDSGEDLEVCFCDTDTCNGSVKIGHSIVRILILTAIFIHVIT